MKSFRIDTPTQRLRLQVRREPYWHKVQAHGYVGFRRTDNGGAWIARWRDDEGKQQYRALKLRIDSQARAFDDACAAARAWFGHTSVGVIARSTVKSACEAYLEKLRQDNGTASAADTEGRFRRLVYDDAIARIELAKLLPRHVAEWKTRTLANGGSRGYYNRNATALRAALNLAKSRHEVATDIAWAEELKPLQGGDARRTLYLDRNARRELVEYSSDELRPLVKALALLPLRPGELVGVRVEHMDGWHGTLQVSGKTGTRTIPLSADALAHFKECAKDKLAAAWLVSRASGKQWDRFSWRDEVKLAAARARLPHATCLYTLRHSTITDLVVSGLDLFTVAKISGTSVAMIEKHYGHLQREHAREALKVLAI